jgi:probable rRNA maturation factor
MSPRSDPAVVVNGALDGISAAAIRAAAARVLAGERRTARIEVTLLGKGAMRRLNDQFLQHDYPTDVVSFPLPQPDGTLAGDIYLCRYVAARQARQHGIPVREELLRLVTHGVLHVLGYDHPSGDDREASPMWQRQEEYLAAAR